MQTMKAHGRHLGLPALAFGVCAAAALGQTGGRYTIDWSSIDGGGGEAEFVGPPSYESGGTVGQPDAAVSSLDGTLTLVGGFWAVASATPMAAFDVVAANPPLISPYDAGQRFRDVLETGTTAALTEGIGGAGTLAQDTITYAPISVTFSGTPDPIPAPTLPAVPGSVLVCCTGGTCPTVMSVPGVGAGPYDVTLSGPIPPGHCTSLRFAGAAQLVQYESLPGDVNLNGSVTAADVQFLVANVANGNAALPANLARFNVNRTSVVNALDVLRLVGLLNGISTTQLWLGASVPACPTTCP